MARNSSGLTLNSEVEVELRRAILGGRIRPGHRLKVAELGATYGVSLSVVREALSRLSAQGLVQAEPQVGFRVTELSVVDLNDLTRVRIDIETLALRRAIAEGDLAWESRVVAAHHSLARSMRPSESDPNNDDRWTAAHTDFHNSIMEGCSSPRLRRIASSLRDSAVLYQRWSQPLHGSRDVSGEHLALLDAVLARDEERAVTILTEHIQRTTEVLLTTLLDAPNEASEGDMPSRTMTGEPPQRFRQAAVRRGTRRMES